ncbi:patched domain-containing protein 3-like [Patella vulgata]|uniref:patched domain-containing protein 3-like n=1 Tax=Patella vulgata TaxID=6465 RepID=UPI00217F8326|nr:patched domain-containing protein 3-like [Patella vulgata]
MSKCREAGADGILGSVSILRLKFYLRQNNNLRSKNWESHFVKAMSTLLTNLTDVAYSTSSSIDNEINQSTGGDEMLYALSLTLLITYACFVASSWNCVSNRSYLAQGGVLAVVLGILASFGILAASGLKFVNIVGVMPFLALGVGVDSMFVIMSEWAEHHDKATTEEQLAATLKGCGGSITIASLTDITAFFIGASSQFISIRTFSVYTGLALAFSYLCHITFFLGCLTIHGRRGRASRHWATCLETNDSTTQRDQGKSPCTVLICAGQPPERREDDEIVQNVGIL